MEARIDVVLGSQSWTIAERWDDIDGAVAGVLELYKKKKRGGKLEVSGAWIS